MMMSGRVFSVRGSGFSARAENFSACRCLHLPQYLPAGLPSPNLFLLVAVFISHPIDEVICIPGEKRARCSADRPLLSALEWRKQLRQTNHEPHEL